MDGPYRLSPPQTCRVRALNPPTQPPSGGIQRGYSQWSTPSGVTYAQPGMTVTDYNRGLRLAQRRPFLGPEYFNGGCAPMYCKDSLQCGPSASMGSAEATGAMFDDAFGSTADFTGNDAPPACFQGKCSGYNSTVGWEYAEGGGLRFAQGSASSGVPSGAHGCSA